MDKKYLLVISNHSPDKWSESQKEGWDKIEYIPFPEIPADASWNDVAKIANSLKEKIWDFSRRCAREDAEAYLNLQGEYTLCFMLYAMFQGVSYLKFAFPTTERKVIENVGQDGVVTKTAVFEFKRWRYKGDV